MFLSGPSRKRVCAVAAGILASILTAELAYAQNNNGQSADSSRPRAVIELFTSQGCSSCPPADRLIGEFSKDPSIVAVTMPIDYWDYLGWKDTLANPKFSERQRAYAKERGDRQVYTPQSIINGEIHALGSSREQIEAAILRTSGADVMSVPVAARLEQGKIRISAAAGAQSDEAEVWICGIQQTVAVSVGRGENSGRTLNYYNVMRRWLKVADWSGKAGEWTVPAENIIGDDVDGVAVYLQRGRRDRPGPMLGAAFLRLPK